MKEHSLRTSVLANPAKLLLGLLAGGLAVGTAVANDRRFTYSYEPETMPKGAWEFEQWATFRYLRSARTGEDNFQRWQFREELEYGVTDNYTVGLYLNSQRDHFTDPASQHTTSRFVYDGVSLENRYQLLNAAEHPVGLTLYLEPTWNGDEFELEQKILLGQRHGAWKWAVNLVHATEWEDDFREKEGELELTAGLSYDLSSRWSLGIEVRDHNELPDYEKWENTALYVGPVVSYRAERWWTTLTVMPQVYGHTFSGGDPDGVTNLELEGHERWNIRLLFGFSF